MGMGILGTRKPGLLQSIWSKRRQGFQPCFEAGIRELPFLMPEPAEKPSLYTRYSYSIHPVPIATWPASQIRFNSHNLLH